MKDRFDSQANGFQLKTVHHRDGWHCFGCSKEYEKQLPDHKWRVTVSTQNGRFQQWQAWNYGCPECITHYLNTVQLVSYTLLDYIEQNMTTEGMVDYVEEHLETVGERDQ